MKAFSLLLAAAIAALWAAAPAQAHPNHAAVSWKQMEPEVVAQFESDGELYSVTNTHQRGLFIGELIQIRDSHGALAHQWWSIHGWCFTAHAYEHQACWSQAHYLNIFTSYLNRASFTPPTGGGLNTEDEYVFCEHYTKLEYKISGDTSDVCDYGS